MVTVEITAELVYTILAILVMGGGAVVGIAKYVSSKHKADKTEIIEAVRGMLFDTKLGLEARLCKDIKAVDGKIGECNTRLNHLQEDVDSVKVRLGIAENDIRHLEDEIKPS